MDLAEFFKSGILELYLLGSLNLEEAALMEQMRSKHPVEISAEIKALEYFFEQDALQNAIKPSFALDKKMEVVFANLELEHQMSIDRLPLINPFSNPNAWLELISSYLPKEHKLTERFGKILRNTDGVMQMLVVSETDIDEEVHEDLEESFLILKGTCTCTIGETSFNMGPGDFMQIPLHEPHTVTLTSPSVTAILQHVTVPV